METLPTTTFPTVPDPRNYSISSTNGFLPDTFPLSRLPDPYYEEWEYVVSNLQALMLSHRLRNTVENLSVLSTVGLRDEAEWRRAYSMLSFMLHAYIWGGDAPVERIPPSIAIPLREVSTHLELPTVATYAAVCLWNFKPLFPDERIDNLESLTTLNTFTGSMNESWFYLVSIVIEARGAPILPLMLGAMRAAQVGDVATVTESLQRFEQYLADLTATMQRIYESCDPFLFYHRIRPFLAGSKNMAEAGLPRGVLYEDGTGDKQYRQYSGGSNAQSSLIQFFDIVLGVEHRPTTSKHHNIPYDNTNNPSKQDNFILQMRSYMPGKHARFLEDTSRVSNIRPFVEKHDNYELSLAYDACLAMLTAFRDQHIAIVTRYIIIPSKDIRACGRSFSSKVGMPSENIAKATTSSEPQAQQGTGGTVLIPFLKQTRDETKKHTILDRKRRSLGE